MNTRLLAIGSASALLVLGQTALAQVTIVNGLDGSQRTVGTGVPPSVDNGLANGVVKPSGSPSVSNGISNGIVKQPGAPSVGNGVSTGAAESPSLEQQTR